MNLGAAVAFGDPPSVLVVIVNYRTPELAIACLESLAEERRRVPELKVALADAASGDDSVPRIRAAIRERRWQEWTSLSPLPRNGGFSYANNAVIRPALQSPDRPRYVLLLNPDTVVLPGGVEALVHFLEEHPAVGIAGSRLQDPSGAPQVSAFRFAGVASELARGMRLGLLSRLLARWTVTPPVRDEPHPTDWVSGASMLVRREVFEQGGLLDESYFLYYEDVDFCLTAHRTGWSCWYVPSSRVVHLSGQSTGFPSDRPNEKRQPYYWFESRRRYYLKNFSPLKALGADLALLIGFALWRVRRFLQRKPDVDPPQFLSDLFRHSVLRRGFRL